MNKKYIQISFLNISEEQKELLIGSLSSKKIDGFEETETGLNAFIIENDFNEEEIKQTASLYDLNYSTIIIEEQNWNEVWESNFDPVIVDDFVAIRAAFHQPILNVEHEIIITPKMSFGTGHHATTYMMMHEMRGIDFKNKSVLDFGTGTGVLAILAEKRGATNVTAIDNDEWSINNAKENFENNHSGNIQLLLADQINDLPAFDIILANINRHIILANLKELKNTLKSGGSLLLSGLLQEDEGDLQKALIMQGFKLKNIVYRDKWIAIICN
ncbi:MAG: ribosomal protein methyltransferase [Chitinophagaceae bacterium]|nr:ribosomal protein methyltransferase [Chitinophagaceae bacterium]